jgi:hypothetical protein
MRSAGKREFTHYCSHKPWASPCGRFWKVTRLHTSSYHRLSRVIPPAEAGAVSGLIRPSVAVRNSKGSLERFCGAAGPSVRCAIGTRCVLLFTQVELSRNRYRDTSCMMSCSHPEVLSLGDFGSLLQMILRTFCNTPGGKGHELATTHLSPVQSYCNNYSCGSFRAIIIVCTTTTATFVIYELEMHSFRLRPGSVLDSDKL